MLSRSLVLRRISFGAVQRGHVVVRTMNSDANSGLARFSEDDGRGNKIPRQPSSQQRQTGGESTSSSPNPNPNPNPNPAAPPATAGKGFGKPASASDAVLKSLGNVSSQDGRNSDGRSHVVLGTGSDTLDAWRELDEKVNQYPCERYFKAIGMGGDEFVASMLVAVESVVGTVHKECIRTRPSRTGKYLTVDVGPVMVVSGEQVIAVYANIKKLPNMVWCL